ncbi:P-loop containing nucleoside triphosphate hydrolase protein [Jackrogersella minutella]|nr:P-loop containing nucleoside triphosphate hydrolase protein [Jackrogersella minutella]
MRSFLSTHICPSCLFAANTRNIVSLTSPSWAAQRFFSGRTRASPSRMVLSDHVADSPKRDTRDHDSKKPRQNLEGPFGGMNQTFASIREPRARSTSKFSEFSEGRGGGDRRGAPRGRNNDRRIKAMKMQGSLATIPYGHRSRVKAGMTEIETFESFPLLPSIQEAIPKDVLKSMVGLKPTPIQRLAIPALLSPRRKDENGCQEFLLAAETGSGKTLAYLLPVIDALKRAEAADPVIAEYREYFRKQLAAMGEPGYTGPREFDPHPTCARPRVVILVPTAELVDQVGKIAKALSHEVKFKACLFSANISATVINKTMFSPTGIDLIVTTPHLLSSIAETDPYVLSKVSHLVVDEADSLFDRSFSPVTVSILDRALPSMKQLILCSATIPKRLDNYLAAEFPDMTRITSPNLHAIPRRMQLGVIDVVKDPYRNNKDLACADAIWSIGKDAAQHESILPGEDVKRIMVFVNEREKTQEVANFLISKGIDAVALHRDTPDQRQSEMLDAFTTKTPMKTSVDDYTVPAPGKGRRSLPNTKVIVATDLASRGIDTLAVRHVILYDVPHTTIDFIHRLGRTGRMGRRGRGIVLVGRDDRKDIVAEVRESMFMGQALI